MTSPATQQTNRVWMRLMMTAFPKEQGSIWLMKMVVTASRTNDVESSNHATSAYVAAG